MDRGAREASVGLWLVISRFSQFQRNFALGFFSRMRFLFYGFFEFRRFERLEFCGEDFQRISVAFFSIGGKFGALGFDFLCFHSLLWCAGGNEP